MHANAPVFENAINQQELLFRNRNLKTLKLPIQPHALDSLDASNNELENFPNLFFPRLKSLFLASNNLKLIEINAPELKSLSLAFNPISDFDQLLFLKQLPKLEYLSLQGTPISRLPDYRSLVIRIQPSVRFLDYQKVTQAERKSS